MRYPLWIHYAPLTPTSPVGRERRDLALVCGDFERYASAANLLTQAARFLLARDEASHAIDSMERQVTATWYPTVRAAGVSEGDCEVIRGAFAYPGFRLES